MSAKPRAEVVKEFYEAGIAKGELAVLYLGLSGVVLRTAGKAVAIDISEMLGSDEIAAMKSLDLLLYTHDHYDHFNLRTATEVFKALEPSIVAEPRVCAKLKGKVPGDKLVEAGAGRKMAVAGVEIEAVQGVHVGPILLYFLDIEGVRVFHGGDSGYVDLKGRSADIAFLPTGAPSPTASPGDALKMALDIRPKLVVPIHGEASQHRELARLLGPQLPGVRIEMFDEFSFRVLKL